MGPVAQDRGEGRVLRPPGCLRLAHPRDEVGVLHRDDAGRAHPPLHREDRQARPLLRQGGHRWHRDRPRLQLAAVLDGHRQPHFKNQPKDQIVVWVYALYSDTPGDYTGKTIEESTGEEITREWLYHLGVPVEEIDELAATGAKAVPVMMPYVTAFFMPRAAGDRPDVVPEGREELRLHRPVRRVGAARLHLHHRVLRADPDGGRLHAHGHRARRA